MVQLSQLREGSRVIVRGDFGNAPPVIGVVTEAEEDIKNGRAGISYDIEGGASGSWAYMHQVDRVLTY